MDSARWAGGRTRRRSTSTSLRSRCKLSGRRCYCIAWERGRRRSSRGQLRRPTNAGHTAGARPLGRGAACCAPTGTDCHSRRDRPRRPRRCPAQRRHHHRREPHCADRTARRAGARVVDLGDRTVLPGLIDAHARPAWYFNRQNRLHTAADGDTPAQSMLAAAANAYATLMAGFTTIQSVGSRSDADLRDWIATQGLPGPRILTSLDPITDRTLSPDSLRAVVRQHKADGADLIKIFASGSIREGGQQTFSDSQLVAACGEARALGLRTLVHAHSAGSVRAATLAGCTEVEHGLFVTQDVLTLMAARGTYFDPQCALIFRNYLDNRAKYQGIGNYTDSGFAVMERMLPVAPQVIRTAIATSGLKVVYGTDAVAGADGHNSEDLICRVQQAGEAPMHAIVAAT